MPQEKPLAARSGRERSGSRPPMPAAESKEPKSPMNLAVTKRSHADVQLVVPAGPPRAESPLRSGIVTEPESGDESPPKRKATTLRDVADAEEIPDVSAERAELARQKVEQAKIAADNARQKLEQLTAAAEIAKQKLEIEAARAQLASDAAREAARQKSEIDAAQAQLASDKLNAQ